MKNSKILNIVFKYLILMILLLITAINYNLFLNPNNIISGGVNGLSIIVQKIFNINPAVFILIFSIIILVFSFIVLGVSLSSSSIISILVYPFLVSITSNISAIKFLQVDDKLLIGLFSGIISGVVIGTICKMGFSQGGIPQISQIINKLFKVPIGKINFLLNTFILILGAFVFDISSVLLGIIIIYISSIIVDRITIGISSNKSFFIITTEEEKIKNFINKELGHGTSTFRMDNDENKCAILTVIPTKECNNLIEGIKKLDNNIFFVVIDSYQLEGGF